jgi:uncharacterized membrane protein
MPFENSLFFMPLLVGTIFSVVGFFMYRFPPKSINYLYGYRTKSSMKSKDCWDFAQKYSAKLMIYYGFGLMFCSVLGLLYSVSEGVGVMIATVELLLVIAILLFKTEKEINKKFD